MQRRRLGPSTGPQRRLGPGQGDFQRRGPNASNGARSAAPTQQPSGPSVEELKKQVETVMREYICNMDAKELASQLSTAPLQGSEMGKAIASVAVDFTFSLRAQERQKPAEAMLKLASKEHGSMVAASDIISVMQSKVKGLEELKYDAPKADEWLGGIMGQAVAAGVVSVKGFVTVLSAVPNEDSMSSLFLCGGVGFIAKATEASACQDAGLGPFIKAAV